MSLSVASRPLTLFLSKTGVHFFLGQCPIWRVSVFHTKMPGWEPSKKFYFWFNEEWQLSMEFTFLSSPPPPNKIAQKSVNFHLEILPGGLRDVRVQLSWSAGGWMVSVVILYNLEKLRLCFILFFFPSLPFHCSVFPFSWRQYSRGSAVDFWKLSHGFNTVFPRPYGHLRPGKIRRGVRAVRKLVEATPCQRKDLPMCGCPRAGDTELAGCLLSSCIRGSPTSIHKLSHSLQTTS